MRYIQRIETDDIKDSYSPESYINITLPRKKVDLQTFTVYYTGLAANAGTETGGMTLKRFFPKLSQSIVSELIIEINGHQKQHIKEYGYLYTILHNILRDDEEVNSSSFDTVSKHNIDAGNGNLTKSVKLQAEVNPTNLGEDFYIDKWLGFLGESNKYLDCTDKDVKIRIKLAPASILYKGINTTGTPTTTAIARNYSLTNVYATVDILDEIPNEPTYNVFVDYMTVQGVPKTDNKRTSLAFSINKPIKYLLGTFTSASRTTENELLMSHCNSTTATFGLIMKDITTFGEYRTIPQQNLYSYDLAKQYKLPYLLNNSQYFQRTGKGILNCAFNVNGYNITPKLSVLGCYKETKKCFGSEYKRVISLASFENDFFCNAVRLDDDRYDLKKIQWDVDTDMTKFQEGGQPIVFVCTESSY